MNKRKLYLINILTCILLLGMGMLMITPFVIALLKTHGGWTEVLLWSPDFLRSYLNTLLVTTIVTVFNIVFSITTAYFFVRTKFRGKNFLYFLCIVLLLLPYQATMLPEYMLVDSTVGLNNLIGVIIPGVFTPFSVIILTQMLRAVPKELFEAYHMESKSEVKGLYYIAVPCVKNGIICCGVLIFSQTWNMIDRPQSLITLESNQLLQQYIHNLDFGAPLFVAITITAIVPLLLFFLAEESLRKIIITDKSNLFY